MISISLKGELDRLIKLLLKDRRLNINPNIQNFDDKYWLPAILFAVDVIHTNREQDSGSISYDYPLEKIKIYWDKHNKILESFQLYEDEDLTERSLFEMSLEQGILETIDVPLKWMIGYKVLSNYDINNLDPESKNPLSAFQIDVLFGLLLGSASIEESLLSKRFFFLLDYEFDKDVFVEYVYSILYNLCHPILGGYQGEIQGLGFKTFPILKLSMFHNFFYVTKTKKVTIAEGWPYFLTEKSRFITFIDTEQKQIPNNSILHNYLNPRSFAFFFMASVSKQAKEYCIRLIMSDFKQKEVERLSQFLENKFGLKCYIAKDYFPETGLNDSCWFIGISKQPEIVQKFLNIVEPYIIPSMKFKLPKIDKK